MSSKLSHSRSDVSTWRTEPLMDETSHWADSKNDNFPIIRQSRRKRARRVLARFLITLCIGVAGTLAWQSYGDAAREMIAKSSPQFSWLAPQAAAVQAPPAVHTKHGRVRCSFSRSASAQGGVVRYCRDATKCRSARRCPEPDDERDHSAAGGAAGGPG